MLAVSVTSLPPHPSVTRPVSIALDYHSSRSIPPFFTKIPTQSPRKLTRFIVFAEDDRGLNKEPNEKGKNENGFSVEEDLKRDAQPIINLRWKDLLDPDPQNILAIGLTGVLTWASAQVLWQLLLISLSILVAALKYSFIAALLIFILITLL
ncbi:PREDICTED: uncharacterized protein LOC104612488 [Nelumbo nucifera]|uniref:Uncharacterized protein LOC104612488 n=2 Tax=Nelumbo nucifera TaxID=4432 RepID=A0A1U8BAG4_NELNU|nr:PREDICTED: uncharacterized protein LOC104612488 [Nelumbo nucifera]DAD28727.1 TPA_asm: hypothetical protein HUJ06_030195 [Nelumbo nucifera]